MAKNQDQENMRWDKRLEECYDIFSKSGGASNIFLRDLYENIPKYPRTKNETLQKELSMNIIFALVWDWAQT
uniref:Uncharacterized protein n=1 Tax=Populus trichocarpa TaxID=3694 RepID=A0A2K1Y8R6_POPTR